MKPRVWQEAKGKGLEMSQKARMRRAFYLVRDMLHSTRLKIQWFTPLALRLPSISGKSDGSIVNSRATSPVWMPRSLWSDSEAMIAHESRELVCLACFSLRQEGEWERVRSVRASGVPCVFLAASGG